MNSPVDGKPDLEKFKEFTERIQNDEKLPQNMSKSSCDFPSPKVTSQTNIIKFS